MSDRITNELIQSNRVLSHHVALLARVERARLPQYLDLDSLKARYALEGTQVRALLTKHQIAAIPHGKGVRVHIDDVLRLDECLRSPSVV